MGDIYYNMTPGKRLNGRGGWQPNARNAAGWQRALNGHTLSAHGKEGNTVKGCPACRDLIKKTKEAKP